MKSPFPAKLQLSGLLFLSFSMHLVSGCNFGFGNLGLLNFGVGNVGIGNKGFLNAGLLNTGFAQVGLRNIGALNVFPIPNTIGVFNVPVYPNLTPPIGRRRRRSTLKYDPLRNPFPWSTLSASKNVIVVLP